MFKYAFLLLIAVVTVTGCATSNATEQESTKVSKPLSFTMKSLDGKDVDLSKYQGKVVLIVNVASKCGLTGQYEQLQELHDRYAEEGLAILGFPCNQFLSQEPGTATEIKEFCRVNYGVTFDMFAKVDVKGENACEFYRFLTSLDTKPKGAGQVSWNFEKFVIDRNGFVVARFGSRTKPDASEIVRLIESELAERAKNEQVKSVPAIAPAIPARLRQPIASGGNSHVVSRLH